MEYLSITEAAKILNSTRQYVWMLIQMGRIKAKKVGKTYIINHNDLINYIKEHNRKS